MLLHHCIQSNLPGMHTCWERQEWPGKDKDDAGTSDESDKAGGISSGSSSSSQQHEAHKNTDAKTVVTCMKKPFQCGWGF